MVGGDHVVTFGSASILRAEYVVDGHWPVPGNWRFPADEHRP